MSDSNHDRIAIVSGVRTPFVRAYGLYKKLPPSYLGGITLRETIARADMDPKMIDECMYGIVTPPMSGPNVAREALFDSDLPPTIAATTINRYCASSLEAAATIAAKIDSGQIDIGLAGGVESISTIPAQFSQDATHFFLDMGKSKSTGQMIGKLSNFKTKYLMPQAAAIAEPTTGLTMGQSGDLMAREFEIGREAQDEFALNSHKKAQAGWDRGFFGTHVVPVSTPEGNIVDKDPDIRADSTMEKLGKLRPVFYKDGTVSAANASPLTDGASACLLMKESKAKELRLPILGVIRSYATAAVDIKKEPLLIGPAYAMPKALKSAGMLWKELDLVEVHEAFAAQVLATVKAIESKKWCKEKLGLDAPLAQVDPGRLNINGGSIPLGHPFGATGVRMILQALHGLREQNKSTCLISVCAAGGLGGVMIVEAV